ncbi:MAG: hypothetical protein R2707_13600 [Acidimicrobiales bacterium]
MPRYATLNNEYLATWFTREDPGGPMWALNLMKYRERADYEDGRETTLSGAEADDLYAPHEQLKAVGSKVVLVAPVRHQLVGDGTVWDRIAIAQYATRMAMIEMNMRDDFQDAHVHKEAGMDTTIVMATFPVDGDPVPPQESGEGSGRLMLLQVVADAAHPDVAADIESTRVGRFRVEDRFLGDHRTFAEARFDLISEATADELAASGTVHDEANYVVVADPVIDEVARSLSDPTRVLF